jgi:hypothetical protein
LVLLYGYFTFSNVFNREIIKPGDGILFKFDDKYSIYYSANIFVSHNNSIKSEGDRRSLLIKVEDEISLSMFEDASLSLYLDRIGIGGYPYRKFIGYYRVIDIFMY